MTWIRTDLRYPSRLDALRTSGAVFGDVIIGRGMDGPDGFVIPECTGIWWLQV